MSLPLETVPILLSITIHIASVESTHLNQAELANAYKILFNSKMEIANVKDHSFKMKMFVNAHKIQLKLTILVDAIKTLSIKTICAFVLQDLSFSKDCVFVRQELMSKKMFVMSVHSFVQVVMELGFNVLLILQVFTGL